MGACVSLLRKDKHQQTEQNIKIEVTNIVGENELVCEAVGLNVEQNMSMTKLITINILSFKGLILFLNSILDLIL